MEGVDAESAVPPPAVVFLHVVAVVRGISDAPEQVPKEWAQRFSFLDIQWLRFLECGGAVVALPI